VEKRKRVIVYGSSLNMAGIAASIKAEAGLEVVSVDPLSPDARLRLTEIAPAAIAFDLINPSPGLEITLLRNQPDLLLIGVDSTNNELLVLSGQSVNALSMADLIDIIHKERGNGTVTRMPEVNFAREESE
jgi:hypothetical protein